MKVDSLALIWFLLLCLVLAGCSSDASADSPPEEPAPPVVTKEQKTPEGPGMRPPPGMRRMGRIR